MSCAVRLTDTAKQDLRDIAFWIADKSRDVAVAKRIVEELRAACNKLDIFPYSGAFPRDRILRSIGYRFTLHKEYLIFYMVDEDAKTVNIIAIFSGQKDYMRVMKKFC